MEIKSVHPKGNQPWIFMKRTDTEVEAPILRPPDAKSRLIRKDPDAGKDWRQEEAGTTEDGWMASLTQWTWVWASSGRWWRTGKPGVLQSMGSQRVRHNWATEQQQAPSQSYSIRHSRARAQALYFNNHLLVMLMQFKLEHLRKLLEHQMKLFSEILFQAVIQNGEKYEKRIMSEKKFSSSYTTSHKINYRSIKKSK